MYKNCISRRTAKPGLLIWKLQLRRGISNHKYLKSCLRLPLIYRKVGSEKWAELSRNSKTYNRRVWTWPTRAVRMAAARCVRQNNVCMSWACECSVSAWLSVLWAWRAWRRVALSSSSSSPWILLPGDLRNRDQRLKVAMSALRELRTLTGLWTMLQ